MARREFSKAVKVAALKRCMINSVPCCEKCGVMIKGKPEFDHFIADGLGGEPTLDNCMALCADCHGTKTAKHDVPAIARAKSREARYLGIRPKSRFPGSRDSGLKKKMDGTVVRRNP